MKPFRMWVVESKCGVKADLVDEIRVIFRTRKEAEGWFAPNLDRRIIQVEIREVPKKRKAREA